ncbi:hypothetical protein D3P05_18575 [Paracoccus siganidrum]|uniref:Uncharacterized protein n=1 Tax=Paracoccus siganidrum TaxID=1276757 RepID=A0A418ZZW7_9RHOB|nr:hypothetical protein D3P05_18575 [Paracoccus siganidrum]
MALSPEAVTALIEVQTLGRITGRPAERRRPTRSDAMLCADFVNALMAEIAQELDGIDGFEGWAGYRYASYLDDPRPLALMLDDRPFRSMAMDLRLGGPQGREARILMAAALEEPDLRAIHGGRIEELAICEWSRREGRVLARRQERLGALVLSDRIWAEVPEEAVARAALEGLRQDGLSWSKAAARLRARIALVDALGPVDDASLLGDGGWLLPWLGKARSLADLRALDLAEPLRARIGWEGQQLLDREVPAHFVTPLGRRVPIDYDHETPSIELRLQELFGVTRHPVVGGRPLRISLLSPGGRPVQVTTDLPGFWATSYGDVRKDMRGRYPRHPWPEDPTVADPTMRAKPRGT